MFGWIDEQTGGRSVGWMDGWMNRQVVEQTFGWTDRWMDEELLAPRGNPRQPYSALRSQDRDRDSRRFDTTQIRSDLDQRTAPSPEEEP